MSDTTVTAEAEHSRVMGVEANLAAIWKATLEVEAVKPEDNFLQLGGDSMTMMIVLSRVREEFGVTLDPTVLFEFPTLRELGQMVVRQQPDALGSPIEGPNSKEIDEGVI